MSDVSVATVRRNAYVDSISLLQVSAELLSLAGVLDAALVMATDLNRQVLHAAGLLVDDAQTAGPNDLVIAVRASEDALANAALEHAAGLLATGREAAEVSGDSARPPARSLRSAHRADPSAHLAVISVPGPYAANEARQALADGLHVFLFSDNVAVADEVDLKRLAGGRNLLVMGPDCGTSILNGVGLGFANVVRRGRIGLVGASGTGLQEVTSLLHQAGEGVSHAIGTGGRDLHAAVAGMTTLRTLDLLRDDPGTDVIVLISKPSDRDVAERVLKHAARLGKPVVVCLLNTVLEPRAGIQIAANLYQAARLAASSAAAWDGFAPEDLPRPRLRDGQAQVRGLFCGGTLCEEAAAAIHSDGHAFTDFGDDRYTQGRAHPMIDPTLRNHAIVEAGGDPRVAVLLLDVILGLGAHPDPAGATVPAVREALATARAAGRELTVLAHVVGTDRDPQGLAQQEATLRSAGVHVFRSNYHAAVAASLLVESVAV
ncbi:MAG TPA: acyl-CoA synthetase FdrA [Chloroflexota bacterium]|nr:acyl-CoA synthetase FdrA [Chloroflexota bacterium]